MARQGLVACISPETVRRILAHHKLKPWRHQLWLSPHTPRDAEYWARVAEVVDLYTRFLRADEVVLCVDEKTSLSPRPRRQAMPPAPPGRPNLVKHEYRRAGALHLLAALDTRTGQVYGQRCPCKRQRELMAFLE